MPEENPTPNTQNTTGVNNDPANPTTTNTPDTTGASATTPSPAPETANTPSTPDAPITPPDAPQPPIQQLPDDTPAPISSPIMKSTVKKQHNKLLPVVVILAVLTLAGLGASIFAFIQNSDKDSEIARLRSELANQGIVIPDTPTEDNKPNDDAPEITSQIRAEVLASVPTNLILSDAKSMNTSSEMSYSAHLYFDSAFNTSLDLSTNQATLTLNWDRIKEIYPYLTTDKTGTESIADLGLSGNPTDVLLTGFGQAIGYEVLFFLMEDGTVEYIPLAKAAKDNNFKSYGKLKNVNNVIKFYSVNSCSKTGPGCGRQTLAQRADGNYYELYEAVNVTGNFEI